MQYLVLVLTLSGAGAQDVTVSTSGDGDGDVDIDRSPSVDLSNVTTERLYGDGRLPTIETSQEELHNIQLMDSKSSPHLIDATLHSDNNVHWDDKLYANFIGILVPEIKGAKIDGNELEGGTSKQAMEALLDTQNAYMAALEKHAPLTAVGCGQQVFTEAERSRHALCRQKLKHLQAVTNHKAVDETDKQIVAFSIAAMQQAIDLGEVSNCLIACYNHVWFP